MLKLSRGRDHVVIQPRFSLTLDRGLLPTAILRIVRCWTRVLRPGSANRCHP
jgi:hypothetical protein